MIPLRFKVKPFCNGHSRVARNRIHAITESVTRGHLQTPKLAEKRVLDCTMYMRLEKVLIPQAKRIIPVYNVL